MSFVTYIKNIQEKTGRSPEEFNLLAKEKGFVVEGTIAPKIKATEITDWLKKEFDLGHGHAMAMYAYLKGKRE